MRVNVKIHAITPLEYIPVTPKACVRAGADPKVERTTNRYQADRGERAFLVERVDAKFVQA